MKNIRLILIFFVAFACVMSANSQTKNDSSAVDDTKQALLSITDSIEHFMQLSNAYLDSSIYFENQDSLRKAFLHYHNHLSYLEYHRQLTNKKMKADAYEFYNIEKAEKEYLLFQREKEIIEYQTNRNNIIIYSLIGLFIILGIILLLIIQINRIKSNRKLIEISERNLRQQLNPEFTLNILNSIQYAIFTDDRNKSHENLSRFAKFMRLVLENSQHKLITLNKEIETINYYLELESFRLKDNFEFRIEHDNNIDTFEVKILPLLIQSIIEVLIEELISDNNIKSQLKIKFDIHSKNIRVAIRYKCVANSSTTDIKEKLNGSRLFNEKIDLIKTVYKTIRIKYSSITKSNFNDTEFILEVLMPLIY